MQLNTSENTEFQQKVSLNKMKSFGRKTLLIVIVLSLGIGFGGGFWFSNWQIEDSNPVLMEIINRNLGQPKEVDFALFWEVWDTLHEKYVNPSKLDKQEMLYGAIEGMVKNVGDPYTVFFEPVISQKFKEEISGTFGGVGIEIGKRNDFVTVIAPIKDSPAYTAGIKAGDKILKVDTKPITDLSIEEVVSMIRGKKGTKVVLTVSSNGDTKDIELTRDTIKIPSLEWELLEGNVAYMQIHTFNQNVDSEFEKASREVLKSSATKLIIDLRNNPGGLLDSAINLAGWFLEYNQVVTMEEFKDGTRQEFKSQGSGALKIYPTIILLNGGSASASEILAGALHDNRSIKIIGEKSFGKGSVQELANYSDGSSLKVTIAKWLTPAGISISEKGIDADVEIKFKEEDLKEEGKIEIGTPGKDAQLDKAIEIIK